MPNTVFDKGVWSLEGYTLRLRSDLDIRWKPEFEREFMALRRPSHKNEILLMGLEKSSPYFEAHSGDDPELMLLIVTLRREKPVNPTAAATLKARLMREAWRPDFFRKQ